MKKSSSWGRSEPRNNAGPKKEGIREEAHKRRVSGHHQRIESVTPGRKKTKLGLSAGKVPNIIQNPRSKKRKIARKMRGCTEAISRITSVNRGGRTILRGSGREDWKAGYIPEELSWGESCRRGGKGTRRVRREDVHKGGRTRKDSNHRKSRTSSEQNNRERYSWRAVGGRADTKKTHAGGGSDLEISSSRRRPRKKRNYPKAITDQTQ